MTVVVRAFLYSDFQNSRPFKKLVFRPFAMDHLYAILARVRVVLSVMVPVHHDAVIASLSVVRILLRDSSGRVQLTAVK